MSRIWDDALTPEDRIVIEKGGYGKSRGLGSSPIIVIIDPQYNYVGEDKPIEQQLDNWPSGGGSKAWKAIRNIQLLKETAASCNIPVMYTRNVQKKTLSFDSFGLKADRDNSKYMDGRPEAQIVKELEPSESELVVDKAYASAFFGTPLISYLIKMRVDSLVLVGGSTSGCVRASAVDAVTHNFNVAVVEDCVYDRIELSHKAALLDLWMKYCDVLPLRDIQQYLQQLKK